MRDPFLLIFFIGLVGCSVGPDYKPPHISLPDKWHSDWKQETSNDGMTAFDSWWKAFEDPVLEGLVEEGSLENLDLKMAVARLEESRALKSGASGALYPDIQSTTSAGRSKQGFITGNRKVTSFEAGFDASWELDLFGKNYRQWEGEAAFEGQRFYELEDVLVSVRAEIAKQYISYREAQKQLKITQRAIKAQKKLLDLLESLQEAGVVSNVELSEGRALYTDYQSRVPVLNSDLKRAQYALEVLLGRNPGSLSEVLEDELPISPSLERINLDVPIRVISRRPDVRAAEQALKVATALQGVAIADLYPNFTIAGFYGLQDSNLFPSGAIWRFAADGALSLFDFGRIRSKIDTADAQKTQALSAYELAVLKALEEVENALTAYGNSTKEKKLLRESLKAREQNLRLLKSKYEAGLTSFQDVLKSQLSFYESDLAVIRTESKQFKNLVALYKALG
ncbi:MAG: efflux transporter outer membrane subunit [Alphaproteobacteria bacterium]|jgi:NodT family efflux transporter outer membrane factor (OMF) lipoprotein|nr:efflux transporter outer membrane subunit [Alphaproteobacteria bacterium]MBT5390350.1 efflux transporter outer membrane subunit [Alphaproteobacteria bacterium]MBT5539977.1 efflux transporter outer membrane subunit [Alphaproteobacteria bacterium]MBT5654610.1 efflux transporter outer membrane subunit [Alphaproteobacteria bacterium]